MFAASTEECGTDTSKKGVVRVSGDRGGSMSKKKRQHILTYHAGRRGWVKKYQGKQY